MLTCAYVKVPFCLYYSSWEYHNSVSHNSTCSTGKKLQHAETLRSNKLLLYALIICVACVQLFTVCKDIEGKDSLPI